MRKHFRALLCLALALALGCGGASALAADPDGGKGAEPPVIDIGDMLEGEDIPIKIPELSPEPDAADVPGVQWNGEDIRFTDGLPEIVGGRIMVPFRSVADAMGFTVEYDDGRITAADGERSIAFTVGEYGYTVTGAAGETGGEADAAPYIKDGVTYVPARFFAEALGCTVLWDEWYCTAVIYDRAALVEDIGSRFTVLGAWLEACAARAEVTEPTSFAQSCALDLTLFNSIDGDSSHTVTGGFEAAADGASYSFAMQLDLSSVVGLFTDALHGLAGYMGEFGSEEDAEYIAGLTDIIARGLSSPSLNLIVDTDGGTAYLHSPELLTALTALAQLEGESLPFDVGNGENVWLSVDIGDMDGVYAGPALPEEGFPIGEYLVSYAEALAPCSSAIYDHILSAADSLERWAGDRAFTADGGAYTAKYDYAADKDGEGADYDLWLYGIQYIRGSLTLDTATGGVAADIDCRTGYGYDSAWPDILMELEVDMGADGGSTRMLIHNKNTCVAELVMDAAISPLRGEIATAPPDGAVVIDTSEYSGGIEPYLARLYAA